MEFLSIVLVTLGIALALGVIAFWITMLVDCIHAPSMPRRERVAWIVAIVFGKLFGAGAYYFLRYRLARRSPAG